MSRFVRHHRLGIARQALPATGGLLITAILAMIVTTPNHAGGKKDPPPPDQQISDSTDLDGEGDFEAIIARPAGDNPNTADPGLVVLQSDSGAVAILQGHQDDDWFGAAVAVAGDINSDPNEDFNGDGYADLIVGAPKELPRGFAYVFFGPFQPNEILEPEDADMTFFPPEEETYDFGAFVRQVADIDCDGVPDIGIGGYQPVPPGGGGGVIIVTYFVSGATGEAIYVAEGETPFNPWLEIVGDAEGDGDVDAADIAIIDRNMGRISPRLTLRDGDFNGDGRITQADMNMAQANLGANHFAVIDNCSNPCPNPPPAGYHCIEDCAGDPVLVPINIWKFCEPIHCQAWCGFEIDGPFPSTQPLVNIGEPVELHAINGLTTHCDWAVLDGEDRIVVLNPPGDTDTNIFRFVVIGQGPVSVRATNEVCTYICEDETSFNITFDEDDSDGDGLDDECEVLLGSDPNDFYDPPTNRDADGDGLDNITECNQGTNPTLPDSDGDGLIDSWEIAYGLNPNSKDSDGDNKFDSFDDDDGDGLINLWEQALGYDPTVADPPPLDSDSDGVSDDCELALQTDPLDPDEPQSNADTDSDRLTDVLEVCVFGTSPDGADSDGDFLPDGWEIDHGLNPLDTDTDNDGITDWNEDSDGNGLTNYQDWMITPLPLVVCPTVGGESACQPMLPLQQIQCVFAPLYFEAAFDDCTAPASSVQWGGDSPIVTWPANDQSPSISIQLIGLGEVNLTAQSQCCLTCNDVNTVISAWIDTDDDGLPDALEILLGLDPENPDTHGTGFGDAQGDEDGDGLTNFEEIILGFWPNNPDSDGDGELDGAENPAEGGYKGLGTGGIAPPDCKSWHYGLASLTIDGLEVPVVHGQPIYVAPGSTIVAKTSSLAPLDEQTWILIDAPDSHSTPDAIMTGEPDFKNQTSPLITVLDNPDGDGQFIICVLAESDETICEDTQTVIVEGGCGGSIELGEAKGLYSKGPNDNRIYTNRIYNEVDPTKPIWTKDEQYIDITVNINGAPVGSKVEWEAIDVDDPSNGPPCSTEASKVLDENDHNEIDDDQDGTVDNNDGNDNTGDRDGPSEFEGIEGFPFTAPNRSAIVNNVSKVRFHATDDAGDNYKIKAKIVLPDGQECDEGDWESEVMTVWHLIELENVRMPSASELPLDTLNSHFAIAFLEWGVQPTVITPDDDDPMGDSYQEAYMNAVSYCTVPPGHFTHDPDSGWYFVASAVRHIAVPPGENQQPLVDGTVHFDPILGGNAVVILGPQEFNENFPDGEHAGQLFFPVPIPAGDIAYVAITKPGDITKSIYFEAALAIPWQGEPQTRKLLDLRCTVRQPVHNPNDQTWLDLPDYGLNPDPETFYKVKVWGPGALVLAGFAPTVGPEASSEFIGKAVVYSKESDGDLFDADDFAKTLVHELTHALGAAHRCGNADYSTSGKSCVMMYFDDWRADTNGSLEPWTGYNVGIELCAEHLKFIRKTNFEDDDDNAPGRKLQWD